jgi:ribonuclease HI
LVNFEDSEDAIKVVLRWVGEGAKTTLATVPDADILSRILEVLRERIEAGAATFLIKIKAHRGEPINEEADTLAEVGKDTAKWTEKMQRPIFKWAGQKKGKQRSKWSAGVRRRIRQRVAQLTVKATREESVKRCRKEQ